MFLGFHQGDRSLIVIVQLYSNFKIRLSVKPEPISSYTIAYRSRAGDGQPMMVQ